MSKTIHIDLLNSLLANVKAGLSYKELTCELMKYYVDVEKNGKATGTTITLLCFLHYILGEFDSVLIYKNKYKVKNLNLFFRM